MKFILISVGMNFCFEGLTWIEDHFRFLNKKWCFRYGDFIYIDERNLRFFEDECHPKPKRFYRFF